MGGVLINDRWGNECTCGLCPWCPSGKVGAYAEVSTEGTVLVRNDPTQVVA